LDEVNETFDSKQMRDALSAIKEKLARMRSERTDTMAQLAATRQAAESSRTDRRSQVDRG
jgi:hypothetical protein